MSLDPKIFVKNQKEDYSAVAMVQNGGKNSPAS
jgi:hypothetical protein